VKTRRYPTMPACSVRSRFPVGCRWATGIAGPGQAGGRSGFDGRPPLAGHRGGGRCHGGTDPLGPHGPDFAEGKISADTAHQSRFRHAASKAWPWAPDTPWVSAAPACLPASLQDLPSGARARQHQFVHLVFRIRVNSRRWPSVPAMSAGAAGLVGSSASSRTPSSMARISANTPSALWARSGKSRLL
jgi:hypothetical protein